MKSTQKKGLFIFLVLLAVAGGFVFLRFSQAVTPFVSENGARSKGPADAPIQIIEYSDFQCPACKKAQPILLAMMREYPEKIRISFQHFPLSGHQWARQAHQAGECAARQNLFWPFHDKLYDTQETWSGPTDPTETFFQYAKDLNLDLDQFASCFADPVVTKAIAEERKQGDVLKVQSTPTFFINGERFTGSVDLVMKGENFIRSKLGLPAKTPVNPSAQSATGESHAGHAHP